MLLNIKIVTEYPIWLVAFCFLAGFAYAFFLYRNDNRFEDVKLWVKRTMFLFRFVTVSILCFLLLSPLIKTIFNTVEKPIIVIAQDNTSSILMNKDSVFYKTEYLAKLENLKQKLSSTYEVRMYGFDEQFDEKANINYTGKITNLSNVFDELENRFYNQNIGAVILATDGIFNEGSNPVYTSQTNGVPIYAIALGDTTPQKDIVLRDVVLNKLTFLGNQFPIEINGIVQEGEGFKTKLEIINKGKVVFEKEYKINSSNFSINENVLIEAKNVGVQHYKVKLTAIENEVSIVNNVQDVYIEVLDGRQEILILANAPHPDLKALKLSIESNENYKVKTQMINDFNGNTEAFSLVILHQISGNDAVVQKLQQSKTSIWYILDAKTTTNQFNKLNIGLEILNSNGQTNQVLASVNEQFPLFSLSESTIKYLNNTTPLLSVFGTYKMNENGYNLLNQKIGSVVTQSPLMTFFQAENKKVAVLAGEGIWRWRIQEFNKTKKHEAIDELINKAVQFLSVKEDKSKFRLIVKNKFLENEEVLFNAELYNDSYELENEPEIEVLVKNEDGEEFKFNFNKTTKAYYLNAGIFNPGAYQYNASVMLGDKKYTEKGEFQVAKIQLEMNNTIANHQLLANLVKKHDGGLFFPSNLEDISDAIQENNNIASIIFEEKDLKELINLKWIFGLILLLLSAEWFLRKRNGAY
ncbi:MAG: hypothetical protein H6587_01175 [Flavobacteriales bacterium]|nr:hypothetical protein [Flavobacteriales bacterium]MCB9363157.1 hypothetical protein [Flavobacteriales bacterium]